MGRQVSGSDLADEDWHVWHLENLQWKNGLDKSDVRCHNSWGCFVLSIVTTHGYSWWFEHFEFVPLCIGPFLEYRSQLKGQRWRPPTFMAPRLLPSSVGAIHLLAEFGCWRCRIWCTRVASWPNSLYNIHQKFAKKQVRKGYPLADCNSKNLFFGSHFFIFFFIHLIVVEWFWFVFLICGESWDLEFIIAKQPPPLNKKIGGRVYYSGPNITNSCNVLGWNIPHLQDTVDHLVMQTSRLTVTSRGLKRQNGGNNGICIAGETCQIFHIRTLHAMVSEFESGSYVFSFFW